MGLLAFQNRRWPAGGGGGGFPSLAGTIENAQSGSNSLVHAFTMPAGITVGELLFGWISIDGTPTLTINTGVSGLNWNDFGQFSVGIQTYNMYWKIAEGSDVLRIDSDASEQSGRTIFRVAGASTVHFGTIVSGASLADADPPSLTPVPGAADYLWASIYGGEVNNGATAGPAGYTDFTNFTGGGTSGSTAVAFRQLNAATEDPGAFTNSANRCFATTLAFAA